MNSKEPKQPKFKKGDIIFTSEVHGGVVLRQIAIITDVNTQVYHKYKVKLIFNERDFYETIDEWDISIVDSDSVKLSRAEIKLFWLLHG